ncbi:MAG: putative sulfate exporter family transporter [Burkholderiales bacterium]|nr:putative sulfate exporter family transporter [Burkholderiales bacterium]
MSASHTHTPAAPVGLPNFLRELWQKEDWWAVWLGLGIVVAAWLLFAHGSSLKWLAVTPEKWTDLGQLAHHFATNAVRYAAQFAFWLAAITLVLGTLRFKPAEFVPSFIFVYLLAVLVFALGQWTKANYYNLEPPLVALLLGLFISNVIGLPKWLDAGFRVEFYIKTGIILLGATVPFTLIAWAGPTAILQASIVSLTTFLVIFFVARRLGLERQLAAVLGAGGAVCGVSAAIAVAGAVGAKKEHAPVAITVVIVWAIVMIFALPFASHALHLPTGVAGAWIGTSEFADAAGIAAAQTYGGYAGQDGIAGTGDQAVWAFTLMKVVGRDAWIGIWAFVLAIVSITRWDEADSGRKADAGEIWRRFPKFVLGFLAASLIVTWISHDYSIADYNKRVVPTLVGPIKDLRTWAFIFCFLSIGLTTRFRDLVYAGRKPFLAFTAGVVVNVALGFVLSTVVFGAHWAALTR